MVTLYYSLVNQCSQGYLLRAVCLVTAGRSSDPGVGGSPLLYTASHQGWALRLGRATESSRKSKIFSVNYA